MDQVSKKHIFFFGVNAVILMAILLIGMYCEGMQDRLTVCLYAYMLCLFGYCLIRCGVMNKTDSLPIKIITIGWGILGLALFFAAAIKQVSLLWLLLYIFCSFILAVVLQILKCD